MHYLKLNFINSNWNSAIENAFNIIYSKRFMELFSNIKVKKKTCLEMNLSLTTPNIFAISTALEIFQLYIVYL